MSKIRSPEIDGFKGLLICLIVLGHNYFFSRFYPSGFSLIYSFHVVSFLLLPYLFLKNHQSVKAILARLLRILAPHLAFMVVAALIYCVVHIVMGARSWQVWLDELPLTLLLQRETLFRENLGAGFLWFLPALAMQALMLFVYQNMNKLGKTVLVVCAVLVHLGLGLLTNSEYHRLPFSLSLLGYLFIIGILIHQIYKKIRWTLPADLCLLGCWLLACWACIHYQFFNPLAGDLYRPPLAISNPLPLICQDAFIVLSFFGCLRCCALCNLTWLRVLGRYSLQIFLLHPFVWQLLWRLGLNNMTIESSQQTLLFTIVSLVVTVAGTFLLAKFIENSPLKSWLFPGQRRIKV